MRKKLSVFLYARVRRFASGSKPFPPKFSNPSFCIRSNHNSTEIASRPDDVQLIQILQSEIAYENSNHQNFGKADKGLLGPFSVASDSSDSQDVILRRSYGREEIAITALLGSDEAKSGASAVDDIYTKNVLFKVCIAKAGEGSILEFDCRSQGYGNAILITRVSFHESPQRLRPSRYRGPAFSTLDYELQDAFREFLEARRINIDLINFLIIHLHNKEQQQYVQWLHYLESIIKKGLESD